MEQKAERLKQALTILLIALLALSAVFCIRGYVDGHFRSVEGLRAYISSFGIFGPLVLMVIQAVRIILPVIPGTLGCLVGGALFGATVGFWCNYIGICAGSLTAFWLARKFGVDLVRKLIPLEKYHSFIQWVNSKKHYPLVVLMIFLLPFTPDDFMCYFSGLTEMSPRRFQWIMLLAKPWCILGYSILSAHFI